MPVATSIEYELNYWQTKCLSSLHYDIVNDVFFFQGGLGKIGMERQNTSF